MKADIEALEGNKVKLSIEVDEAEFEKAVDAAFRKISREVRVPGFRPGKAPRRILEARLGKEAGRAEALRDSLPDFYARALRDHEVDAIAPPEIDITAGQEAGPVTFDAVVEVRPQLKLAGYDGLRVVVPSPEVTEQDVAGQLDRLRNNFGELVAVDRPATAGDHVTIDLSGERDGEAQPSLSTSDFVYELGSNTVLPELDEKLEGVTTGETRTFEASLPDGPVELTVVVKDVKEKQLPEATDEWAAEASEFASLDELRADIVDRMGKVKRVQATMSLRSGAIDALVQLVDSDPPEALVNAEVERQAHELGHRLEAQGITVEQYLQISGQDGAAFVASLREQAGPAVKADLALRAVAEGESIEVTDDDVDAEIARLAASYSTTPEDLRRQVERADQLPVLRTDLRKGKALDWLVEHVEVVDEAGQAIDREALAPVADDRDDDGPDDNGPDDHAGHDHETESQDA